MVDDSFIILEYNIVDCRIFNVCKELTIEFEVAAYTAQPKIQQLRVKGLVICLFWLIWQCSSNHKTYNKGWFKVIATYLQQ